MNIFFKILYSIVKFALRILAVLSIIVAYKIFGINIYLACFVVGIVAIIYDHLSEIVKKKWRKFVRKNDKVDDFAAELEKLKVSRRVATALYNYFLDRFKFSPRINDNLVIEYELFEESDITDIVRAVIAKLGEETKYKYTIFSKDSVLDIKEVAKLIQKQFDKI